MRGNPVLVQKFGGTSVAAPDRRQMVVEHVRRAREQGYSVAVVVSAMGRGGDPYATDTLLDLLRADGADVRPADYTLMFVTGEIISVALMSHTLTRAGIPAVGLSGAQARVYTDGHPTEAEIVEIDVSRLLAHLERGEVPVVAGGQGIERESLDYNTLGRGASDTSGVALAVALGAERVEIFTDVEGVATGDPRIVPDPMVLSEISFERMHELARYGAKVIHPRAVRTGWRGGIPIIVRSTFSLAPGTRIKGRFDEPVFSGIGVLRTLYCMVVPPAAIASETLVEWERRRVIMSLVDGVTGMLVLGCADAGELQRAVAGRALSDNRVLGSRAWVSIVGETGALAARWREDADVLVRAGVRPEFVECGPFRSTFVVGDDVAQVAVRVLHDAYAQAPCP